MQYLILIGLFIASTGRAMPTGAVDELTSDAYEDRAALSDQTELDARIFQSLHALAKDSRIAAVHKVRLTTDLLEVRRDWTYFPDLIYRQSRGYDRPEKLTLQTNPNQIAFEELLDAGLIPDQIQITKSRLEKDLRVFHIGVIGPFTLWRQRDGWVVCAAEPPPDVTAWLSDDPVARATIEISTPSLTSIQGPSVHDFLFRFENPAGLKRFIAIVKKRESYRRRIEHQLQRRQVSCVGAYD